MRKLSVENRKDLFLVRLDLRQLTIGDPQTVVILHHKMILLKLVNIKFNYELLPSQTKIQQNSFYLLSFGCQLFLSSEGSADCRHSTFLCAIWRQVKYLSTSDSFVVAGEVH